MLNLSEILIRNPQLESFSALIEKVREGARSERFFRMDVRPPFPDTPSNWESVLESNFSSVVDSPTGPAS